MTVAFSFIDILAHCRWWKYCWRLGATWTKWRLLVIDPAIIYVSIPSVILAFSAIHHSSVWQLGSSRSTASHMLARYQNTLRPSSRCTNIIIFFPQSSHLISSNHLLGMFGRIIFIMQLTSHVLKHCCVLSWISRQNTQYNGSRQVVPNGWCLYCWGAVGYEKG